MHVRSLVKVIGQNLLYGSSRAMNTHTLSIFKYEELHYQLNALKLFVRTYLAITSVCLKFKYKEESE